jgi:hypothetical protein
MPDRSEHAPNFDRPRRGRWKAASQLGVLRAEVSRGASSALRASQRTRCRRRLLWQLEGSGFRLNRLDCRAFSLYCSSQALDARLPWSTSNEPGGVATQPRHLLYSAFQRSCQTITRAINLPCLGPAIVGLGATRMAQGHLHFSLTATVACPSRR